MSLDGQANNARLHFHSLLVSVRQAVVICTRNRPADLRRTLGSIAEQRVALLVVVVDASDEAQAAQNRSRTDCLPHSKYLAYPGAPSSARQRNFGVNRLPASAEVVHFLDDDVTLLPNYFCRLTETLCQNPELGGVGGIMTASDRRSSKRPSLAEKLFLLGSASPGRVLSSGFTTPARLSNVPPSKETAGRTLVPVQWLSSCASSYRRAVFDEFRFAPSLSDYAMLEDLDFSYRVGQVWKLAVAPTARLVHHVSPTNRYNTLRLAQTSTIHRYWFMEKNIRHPLRKPAFWWATLGQALARLTSRKPTAKASLRGLWEGVQAIWRRDHPLLQQERNRQ